MSWWKICLWFSSKWIWKKLYLPACTTHKTRYCDWLKTNHELIGTSSHQLKLLYQMTLPLYGSDSRSMCRLDMGRVYKYSRPGFCQVRFCTFEDYMNHRQKVITNIEGETNIDWMKHLMTLLSVVVENQINILTELIKELLLHQLVKHCKRVGGKTW